MKFSELKILIEEGAFDSTLVDLYGEEALEVQRNRYLGIHEHAKKYFKDDDDVHLFSAPGRCEIGGNHTDHQLGRVVAASIDLDAVGIAKKTDDGLVSAYSAVRDYAPIDINDLDVRFEEKNTAESIMRGVLYKLKENGHNIGGFLLYEESNVTPGLGISSSAAFEVLIGNIVSSLYNDGKIDAVEIAKIGQFAENKYFMKSCGLLDQLTSSVGSVVLVDFYDEENPEIEKIPFNIAEHGYEMVITDTRCSHDDLSDEYSAIPNEMKGVALQLGESVLSRLDVSDLIENATQVREKCGDRAFLRAYHFFEETERALDEAEALKANDFEYFLGLINASGQSSWRYLPNVIVNGSTTNQEVAIALALSEAVLLGNGAYRVHGGGFGGTILAFVPKDDVDLYIETMEKAFGKDCCHCVHIRNVGGIEIRKEEEKNND